MQKILIGFDDEREPTLGEMALLQHASDNDWECAIELICLRASPAVKREDLEAMPITEAIRLIGDCGDSMRAAVNAACERVRLNMPDDWH